MAMQGEEEDLQGAGEAADAEAEGDAVELEVVQEEKAATLERLLGLLRLGAAGHAGALCGLGSLVAARRGSALALVACWWEPYVCILSRAASQRTATLAYSRGKPPEGFTASKLPAKCSW